MERCLADDKNNPFVLGHKPLCVCRILLDKAITIHKVLRKHLISYRIFGKSSKIVSLGTLKWKMFEKNPVNKQSKYISIEWA